MHRRGRVAEVCHVDWDMPVASEHNSIREQAEHWWAQRRDVGAMQASEREFEVWLTADPRHRDAYEATEAMWNELGGLRFSQRLKEMAVAESGPATGRGRVAKRALVACMAITLAVVGFRVLQPAPVVPWVVAYATQAGQQDDVELSDGSRILLGSATRVGARYDAHSRQVILHEGEASFDVARDVDKPFVVRIGEGQVTALGTRFLVSREDNEVRVTLSEGSVRIENGAGAARMLEPGDQALFEPSAGMIRIQRVDLDVATSWTRGRLDFRDVRLVDAITQANRHGVDSIKLADSALGELRVSGNFRVGDNEGMANAFAAALALRVDPQSDGSFLLTSRR